MTKVVKKAKKVAKVSRKGVLTLADLLVHNKKKYSQNTFGAVSECGTVCCLAGFAYANEIGFRKYNKLVKDTMLDEDDCLNAGEKLLGISHSAQLFNAISVWPDDLSEEYHQNGPKGRVVVALKALQRLKPNGTIDYNPKAVHTKIPQLKELVWK